MRRKPCRRYDLLEPRNPRLSKAGKISLTILRIHRANLIGMAKFIFMKLRRLRTSTVGLLRTFESDGTVLLIQSSHQSTKSVMNHIRKVQSTTRPLYRRQNESSPLDKGTVYAYSPRPRPLTLKQPVPTQPPLPSSRASNQLHSNPNSKMRQPNICRRDNQTRQDITTPV